MLEPTTRRAGAFAIAVMLAAAQASPAAQRDDALEAFDSESAQTSPPGAG